MRIAMWIAPALLLAGGAAAVQTAQAKTVPIVGKDKVKGDCGAAGGTYGTNSHTGSYSCLNPDGSGISCGGWSAAQKKTCDKWSAEVKVEEQPARVRSAMTHGKVMAKAKLVQ